MNWVFEQVAASNVPDRWLNSLDRRRQSSNIFTDPYFFFFHDFWSAWCFYQKGFRWSGRIIENRFRNGPRQYFEAVTQVEELLLELLKGVGVVSVGSMSSESDWKDIESRWELAIECHVMRKKAPLSFFVLCQILFLSFWEWEKEKKGKKSIRTFFSYSHSLTHPLTHTLSLSLSLFEWTQPTQHQGADSLHSKRSSNSSLLKIYCCVCWSWKTPPHGSFCSLLRDHACVENAKFGATGFQ